MNEALQYLSTLPDEQARLDAIAEDLKNGTKRFDFAPTYGDTKWGGLRKLLDLELFFDAVTKAERYTRKLDFEYFFNENNREYHQDEFEYLLQNNPIVLTKEEIDFIQNTLANKGELNVIRKLVTQKMIDLMTIDLAESNGIDDQLTYYSFRASDGTELKFTTFAAGGGICDPGQVSLCSTPYRTIYVPSENGYLLVSTDYLDGRII